MTICIAPQQIIQERGSVMDLSRALSAPFKDQDWVVKFLLGGLWGLLVVTAPAQLGAMMSYIRSVASDDESLPAWSNFGEKWVNGLLLIVAMIIYMLPAIILYGIVLMATFIPFLTTVQEVSPMSPMSPAYDMVPLAAPFIMICLLGAISVIWTIVASIPMSAGMVNYSITGRFGSMFAIGELIGLIRSKTGFFKAWGLNILIAVVTSIVVNALMMMIIGYVLWPWIYFFAYMAGAHIFGQWAKVAMNPGQNSVSAYPVAPAPPGGPNPPAPLQ